MSDFNARYYDPYLNRFISADSIIPNYANPQSLNRYSYVYNNPVRHTDPSGHCIPGEQNECDPGFRRWEEGIIFNTRKLMLANMVWNEQAVQAGLGESEESANRRQIWVLAAYAALNREAQNGDARTIGSLEQVLAEPSQFLGYKGAKIPADALKPENQEKWNFLYSMMGDVLSGNIADPTSGAINAFSNVSKKDMPGTEIKAIDQYEKNLLKLSGLADLPGGVSVASYLHDNIGYGNIVGAANIFVYNNKRLSVSMEWIGEEKKKKPYPKIDVSNGQAVH